MAKHRDNNAEMGIPGREEFQRANAPIIIAELKAKIGRMKRVITRLERQVRSLKAENRRLRKSLDGKSVDMSTPRGQ